MKYHQSQQYKINTKNQLKQLFAFIILFEKKIENIKIKLTGNQQFHSKLAFYLIDQNKKNKIVSKDIANFVNLYANTNYTESNAQLFCKKYGVNVEYTHNSTQNQNGHYNQNNQYGLSYLNNHQFLKYLSPHTNRSLSNCLMLRVQPSSTITLPPSLHKLFIQLLSTTLQMISVTQSIKQRIYENNQLTIIEIIQMVNCVFKSNNKLWGWIMGRSGQTYGSQFYESQEFDFTQDEVRYLCYHLKQNKCEQIDDMGEEDIRQIILPIDIGGYKNRILSTVSNWKNTETNNMKSTANYSKTNYFLPKSNPYFHQPESSQPNNKYKNDLMHRILSSTGVNFLNVNYKKTSTQDNFYNCQNNNNINQQLRYNIHTKKNFNKVNENNNRFDFEEQENMMQFSEGVQTKMPTAMVIGGYGNRGSVDNPNINSKFSHSNNNRNTNSQNNNNMFSFTNNQKRQTMNRGSNGNNSNNNNNNNLHYNNQTVLSNSILSNYDFRQQIMNSKDYGTNNHKNNNNNNNSNDHNIGNFMIQKFTKHKNDNKNNNHRESYSYQYDYDSDSIASSINSQRRSIFNSKNNNQNNINNHHNHSNQYKENMLGYIMNNKQIQKFEDDYYNNRSQISQQLSRNSAFVQY